MWDSRVILVLSAFLSNMRIKHRENIKKIQNKKLTKFHRNTKNVNLQ